jgi:hypothetical protein
MAVVSATQEVFAHTDAITEIWTVPAGTPQRTVLRQVSSGRVGVTLTRAAGGSARQTIEVGPYQTSRPAPVGVGNEDVKSVAEHAVGVALDGTWEFTGIAGATTATPQGTPVYIEADGDLTLTEAGSTRAGVVNYPGLYTKAAGKLPVKIGA